MKKLLLLIILLNVPFVFGQKRIHSVKRTVTDCVLNSTGDSIIRDYTQLVYQEFAEEDYSMSKSFKFTEDSIISEYIVEYTSKIDLTTIYLEYKLNIETNFIDTSWTVYIDKYDPLQKKHIDIEIDYSTSPINFGETDAWWGETKKWWIANDSIFREYGEIIDMNQLLNAYQQWMIHDMKNQNLITIPPSFETPCKYIPKKGQPLSYPTSYTPEKQYLIQSNYFNLGDKKPFKYERKDYKRTRNLEDRKVKVWKFDNPCWTVVLEAYYNKIALTPPASE